MNTYRETGPMRPEIHPDNLDKRSGWLMARYEIVIKRDADAVWKYIYDPKTWTASNPDEHRGLVFFNDENRPKTGVGFHQKESVAGVPADLYGNILLAEPPNVCVWSGVARYRLFGFIPFSVPEAGVVRQEKAAGGVLLSHTVFLNIPGTPFGSLLFSISRRFSQRPGYLPHTFKELLYFKRQLEKTV